MGGAVLRLQRSLLCWIIPLIIPLAFLWAAVAAHAEASSTSLDQIKGSLDEIETTVGREDITSEALAGLREKLNADADALRDIIDELEPRARDTEERLNQLGPAPEKDEPPELEQIARQREELTTSFREVDGALKAARLLSVRIDQLSERVSQKRHALYARELFARTASVLAPSFWAEAWHALPIELRRANFLFETWRDERGDSRRLASAALIFVAIGVITVAATRRWFPRLVAPPWETSSAKAAAALRVLIWFAVRTPVAGIAAYLALDTLGLLNMRVEQVAQGLLAGIAVAAFGHAVARALFAVEEPQRRLVAEDDETARCFHNHLVWAARVLGVAIPLQVLHKILFAPLIITIATNAMFAGAVAAFLGHLAFRLGRIKNLRGSGLVAVTSIHPLALLLAVLICLRSSPATLGWLPSYPCASLSRQRCSVRSISCRPSPTRFLRRWVRRAQRDKSSLRALD